MWTASSQDMRLRGGGSASSKVSRHSRFNAVSTDTCHVFRGFEFSPAIWVQPVGRIEMPIIKHLANLPVISGPSVVHLYSDVGSFFNPTSPLVKARQGRFQTKKPFKFQRGFQSVNGYKRCSSGTDNMKRKLEHLTYQNQLTLWALRWN